MTARKYFGTDGIRGKVGTGAITPEYMMRLGYGIGKVLGSNAVNPKVVIGKDTRISGYLLESSLQAGLIASGMSVLLTGPLPTPAIAYLTRKHNAKAGIVISASHNPFQDNGIKIFSQEGSKLDDAIELEIEAYMDKSIELLPSESLGKVNRIDDALELYLSFCLNQFPETDYFHGVRCVIDCANGATYQVAPKLFRLLGLDVITIGTSPDGLNINEQCGSTSPKQLQQKVLETDAAFGIAFDGDGDRVLFVDEKGELVDGDQLLYMIACLQKRQGHCPGVVGTQMSNLGLELALKEKGIPFARSKVGDRYVLAECKKRNWLLGGESSGHILSLMHTTTGDGIVSALQVLAAIVAEAKTLAELVSAMVKCPQILVNVPVLAQSDPMSHPDIIAAVKDVESTLKGEGRVLLRRSGTEHLVRVMVEGHDYEQIGILANSLASVVETVAQKAS